MSTISICFIERSVDKILLVEAFALMVITTMFKGFILSNLRYKQAVLKVMEGF